MVQQFTTSAMYATAIHRRALIALVCRMDLPNTTRATCVAATRRRAAVPAVQNVASIIRVFQTTTGISYCYLLH